LPSRIVQTWGAARSASRHGAEHGIEVSICGDIAGDPAYTSMLLGAGLRTFSVAPADLGRVKAAIAGITLERG
jgi:phosphotransferase system enzyme I (PtsI)